MVKRSAAALIIIFCAVTLGLGHEGKAHVLGIITGFSASHVTVRTMDGKTTTILLTKETRYLKGEKGESSASASDLKVGQRIVAEVKGQGQKAAAIEIRLGIQGTDHGIKHDTPKR